ncbi:MAG TPA: hypothetical protein VMG41_08030 [Gemmatimonadales bacterium]|nr:hypothetical protein [Gemmatimonadales bacterium]
MKSEHRTGPPCVIKVGGGLLTPPGGLPRLGETLATAAGRRKLVIVPGGGPFADAVREFERRHGLSATAAHWMAILGMDQYAHALAHHIPGGRVVEDQPGIHQAWRDGAVPVLAPSRWLRAADLLPHSWEVTSDSLAACLAGLLQAEELVLIKPKTGGAELVDPYFDRALPAGIRWRVVSVDSATLGADLAD